MVESHKETSEAVFESTTLENQYRQTWHMKDLYERHQCCQLWWGGGAEVRAASAGDSVSVIDSSRLPHFRCNIGTDCIQTDPPIKRVREVA
jgi:hypothetical protein